MPDLSPAPGTRTTLADKLNLLFETIHPADRGPYSNREVAEAIRARGREISDVYLWQLRSGRRDNPTKEHLETLAEFFDVDPGYFFDRREHSEIARDLRAMHAMSRLGVRKVAARLAHLPDTTLDAVGEILDRVMRALDVNGHDPNANDANGHDPNGEDGNGHDLNGEDGNGGVKGEGTGSDGDS